LHTRAAVCKVLISILMSTGSGAALLRRLKNPRF
jgi:hypothetical protein